MTGPYPNDQGDPAGAIPVYVTSSIQNAGTAVASANTAVTNGGTAVVVFPAGSIVNEGIIANPSTATELLIVNPVGNAGTVEGGSNFGVQPGQQWTSGPSSVAVTANAITSGHTFTAVSR